MTPLAYAIAKQAALKPRKRKELFSVDDKAPLDHANFVSDIHCFECTDVFEIAMSLAESEKLEKLLDERMFLPAPKTWIEHKNESGRHGWLLTDKPFRFNLIADGGHKFGVARIDIHRGSEDEPTARLVFAMLALINAPHIISQERFEPHRELVRLWQRRDRHAPLHAWHELKLCIAKPADIDDDEPHASHIGGRRALHFCRSHLRIRQGRLEFVTSHWRGDPALGTKQARYRVVA